MADEQKQQTIAEEAGLPENWVPLDVPPIIPSASVPMLDGSSRLLQGSIPPSYQHDTSFVGTAYKSDRSSNLSLMPLGIQGNAVTNAAIQSTAAQTPTVVPSTAPSKLVSLSIPNIFTPILQTEDSNGLLAFTLAPEALNTVFAGPGGTALDEIDNVTTGFAAASPLTMTGTPTRSGDLAVLFTCQDHLSATGFNPGAPWVSVAFGAEQTVYEQVLSGLTPASATGATGAAGAWASILALFTAKVGFTPTVVNHSTIVSGAFSSWTNQAIGFSPTNGNTLIAFFMSGNTSFIGGPSSITFFGDSQANIWTVLGSVQTSSGSGEQVIILGAQKITGGATTFTGSISPSTSNGLVGVIEVSNLDDFASIPTFRFLVPTDIPPINLAKNNANGGVTGILGRGNLPVQVAYTDVANIFTTTQKVATTSGPNLVIDGNGNGGHSQFDGNSNLEVRYDLSPFGSGGSGIVTIGGTSTFPILVLAPAGGTTGDSIQAMVPGSTTLKNFILASTGKISNYGGIATVSNGVPSEYATVDLTAQAANIGATTLYAVPSTGAGMYRISSYIVMTTAASASSTLPTVQIVYTDPDANVSVTIDATPVSGSAGLGQTGALTANSVGSAASGVIVVNVKASTTIQYQTVNYASTLAGMQYAVHLKIEAM